jgi:hypothetical protein
MLSVIATSSIAETETTYAGTIRSLLLPAPTTDAARDWAGSDGVVQPFSLRRFDRKILRGSSTGVGGVSALRIAVTLIVG